MNLRRKAPIIVLAVTLLSGCFVVGCVTGKFPRQSFETIYEGMPAWAVEQKLGTPQQQSADRWVYLGEMPYWRAEIHFENNRVVDKKWSNEKPSQPSDNSPQKSQKIPK